MIVAVVLGLPGHGAEAADYLCQRDGTTYWVKVEYETPNADLPCSVYRWVLSGERELMWRATQERGFCEVKAEEVKQKLVSYGWDCLELDGPADADAASQDAASRERPKHGARTPVM